MPRALLVVAVAACGRLGFESGEQAQYLFVDDTQGGPDGTTASYFATDGAHDIAVLGLTGRYAQYRVRFATAMPSISPALLRVTATGRRP